MSHFGFIRRFGSVNETEQQKGHHHGTVLWPVALHSRPVVMIGKMCGGVALQQRTLVGFFVVMSNA